MWPAVDDPAPNSFLSSFTMTFLSQNIRVLPFAALLLGSCNSSQPATTSKPPLQKNASILTSASTPNELTLAHACALAVQHHPSLATYPMDRRASDARLLKASRRPNPELSFDVEDFLGSGITKGLSSSVLNALFSQVIERGGKREARTAVARADAQIIDAEYQVRRRQLIEETGKLYITSIAAHENVSFLEAALARSQETLQLVTKLADAGRVTQGAVQQAELEVQKMELEIHSARQERTQASRALTAQWGDSKTILFQKTGLGAPPKSLPSRSSIQSGLAGHPSLLLAREKTKQAEANLKLANSDRFGDITLSGGVRHDSGSDENSGLLGLSMPVPLFDKREDAMTEMSALLKKTRVEAEGAKRRLNTEFSLAWSDLTASHRAALQVKTSLLPAAANLFKSAEESFRVGKMTSLEYLAAQQQFHDIREKWLSARRSYQLHAAKVQALTNRSL